MYVCQCVCMCNICAYMIHVYACRNYNSDSNNSDNYNGEIDIITIANINACIHTYI